MQLHVVGGFLGSGKSTAIATACKSLADRKLTAGVITNDQGKYLVDTAFYDMLKIPAVQVTGGCFCCNYDDLNSKLDRLVHTVQPDVVFAEAVGSCADVVATVIKPLHELEKTIGSKATYSVFADTRLCSDWLDGRETPFSEPVMYLYSKQIEEAGLLVLNKRNLVSPEKARLTMEAARSRFPGKSIRLQNSLDLLQVDAWLDELSNQARQGIAPASLQIDYNRYAASLTAIGWLDSRLQISMTSYTDLRQLMVDWVAGLNRELHNHSIGVGHIKIMLKCGHTESRVSLTAGDTAGWRAQIPDMHGKELNLLLNARAETDPALLRELVIRSLEAAVNGKGQVQEKDTEAFTLPYPKPKRRVP